MAIAILFSAMPLNLPRDEVRDYIFGVLDRLATDYPIWYLK